MSAKVLEWLLGAFVLVSIILALFFGGKGINLVTEVFTFLFTKAVFSIVSAALAGAVLGLIPLNLGTVTIPCIGLRFSIVGAVLGFLIRVWLF